MTKEFYNRFEMQVRPSNRRLRRMKPPHLRTDVWNSHLSDELVWNVTEAAEEVDCMDITIPADRLEELEDLLAHYKRLEEDRKKHRYDVIAEMREDERVRIKNPVVARAYDHYLTLLNLCRD